MTWKYLVSGTLKSPKRFGGRDEADGERRGDAASFRSCGWEVSGIQGEDPGWTGAVAGVGWGTYETDDARDGGSGIRCAGGF